ncbi:hypothetical protein OAU25_03115 [Crocinitomicaceae bacterium]|nr:hypothetical protein [Crocinitomicaceae bacterium]
MKNFNYLLIVLFFSTSACNKLEKTKRLLHGTWEIISYRTVNLSGLTEYHNVYGNITFGNDSDSTFTYSEDFQISDSTIQQIGIGTFQSESGHNYIIDINTPIQKTFHDCSIKVLTKDDLKLEHRDGLYTHTFVLKND